MGIIKPNLGIREVTTVQVIRTLTAIGTGVEDDPVRTVWQYWTLEGEELGNREYGVHDVSRNPFALMESWVNAYEGQVGDGKAREFYDWVNQQPMSQ